MTSRILTDSRGQEQTLSTTGAVTRDPLDTEFTQADQFLFFFFIFNRGEVIPHKNIAFEQFVSVCFLCQQIQKKITALHLELQLPNVNISAWRVPRKACGPFWSSARMVGWAPQKCKAKGGTWNTEVEVMPQIGLMGSRLTIEINQLVLFCLFTYIYI